MNDLSRGIVRNLSGAEVGDRSISEPGEVATGDPEDQIRGSPHGLAGRPDNPTGSGTAGWSGRAQPSPLRGPLGGRRAGGADGQAHQPAVASSCTGRPGRLVDRYRSPYARCYVSHFHSWYARKLAGARSYSWLKNTLQAAGAVQRAKGRDKHRRCRGAHRCQG